MKKTKDSSKYERILLDELLSEFDPTDHSETERKIKRRLRFAFRGPYDQSRVDILREFKNDVQDELHKRANSEFHTDYHGKYPSQKDWDFDELMQHMMKRHPKVSDKAIGDFLHFAIMFYYEK